MLALAYSESGFFFTYELESFRTIVAIVFTAYVVITDPRRPGTRLLSILLILGVDCATHLLIKLRLDLLGRGPRTVQHQACHSFTTAALRLACDKFL